MPRMPKQSGPNRPDGPSGPGRVGVLTDSDRAELQAMAAAPSIETVTPSVEAAPANAPDPGVEAARAAVADAPVPDAPVPGAPEATTLPRTKQEEQERFNHMLEQIDPDAEPAAVRAQLAEVRAVVNRWRELRQAITQPRGLDLADLDPTLADSEPTHVTTVSRNPVEQLVHGEQHMLKVLDSMAAELDIEAAEAHGGPPPMTAREQELSQEIAQIDRTAAPEAIRTRVEKLRSQVNALMDERKLSSGVDISNVKDWPAVHRMHWIERRTHNERQMLATLNSILADHDLNPDLTIATAPTPAEPVRVTPPVYRPGWRGLLDRWRARLKKRDEDPWGWGGDS